MKNRFNLTEEEKNYIRGLHGIGVITEQDDATAAVTPTEEKEDSEIVADGELTDEDIADIGDDEDSWLVERWEDLSEGLKKVFGNLKRFNMCRGKSTCASFNSTPRQRRQRMLRNLKNSFPRLRWPKWLKKS